MTTWRVIWTTSARNYYSKMEKERQKQANAAIQELEKDPFSCKDAKRLHGKLEGLYRYRLGKFRMIFRIVQEAKEVRIIAIASRGDIYK